MERQKELKEKNKQETINNALSVKLSDGIYIIFIYNRHLDISNQIDIYQVFQSSSHATINDWIKRCEKIVSNNWDVGDALVENAHQKKATSTRYENARDKLMKDNPGFSKKTYTHVIQLGASNACH